MGYITRGKGISVHRADCTNLTTLMNAEKERFIDVSWDKKAPYKFNAEIQIEALDRTKLLSLNISEMSFMVRPNLKSGLSVP